MERWIKQFENGIRIYEIDRLHRKATLARQTGNAGHISDVSIQLITNQLDPETLTARGFRRT